MKAILINKNPAISRLITLSLQKLNIAYKEIENQEDLENCDILIVDSECEYDISLCQSVSQKFILILPKGETSDDAIIIHKPFLPTDFIELINSFKDDIKDNESDSLDALEIDNDLDDSLLGLDDIDLNEELISDNISELDSLDNDLNIDNQDFNDDVKLEESLDISGLDEELSSEDLKTDLEDVILEENIDNNLDIDSQKDGISLEVSQNDINELNDIDEFNLPDSFEELSKDYGDLLSDNDDFDKNTDDMVEENINDFKALSELEEDKKDLEENMDTNVNLDENTEVIANDLENIENLNDNNEILKDDLSLDDIELELSSINQADDELIQDLDENTEVVANDLENIENLNDNNEILKDDLSLDDIELELSSINQTDDELIQDLDENIDDLNDNNEVLKDDLSLDDIELELSSINQADDELIQDLDENINNLDLKTEECLDSAELSEELDLSVDSLDLENDEIKFDDIEKTIEKKDEELKNTSNKQTEGSAVDEIDKLKESDILRALGEEVPVEIDSVSTNNLDNEALPSIDIDADDDIDEISENVTKAVSEAIKNSTKNTKNRIKDINISINISFKD